jgi:hypothetical protein
MNNLDIALKLREWTAQEPGLSIASDSLRHSPLWVACVSQSRGSDAAEVSNFRIFKEVIEDRYPHAVAVERYSHWAFGWSETVLVKALDYDANSRPVLTPAGDLAVNLLRDIEAYGVLSEEDYAREEYEQQLDRVAFMLPYMITDWEQEQAEKWEQSLSTEAYASLTRFDYPEFEPPDVEVTELLSRFMREHPEDDTIQYSNLYDVYKQLVQERSTTVVHQNQMSFSL